MWRYELIFSKRGRFLFPQFHIQNLTHVLRECRKKHIEVALSNPCFDLWLLLHIADFPEENMLTCDEVADRLRTSFRFYDWDEHTGEVRWMGSWDTTEEDVDRCAAAIAAAVQAA